MTESETNEQVRLYGELRPVYELFAEILKDLLARAVKQLGVEGIVQGRAKELASFAEKAMEKETEYPDPVNSMNDLCGARVIVERKDQVDLVCSYIRAHFRIDEDHPDNVLDRLGTDKFGYRARHFVVSLKDGEFDRELENLVALQAGKGEQARWREALRRIRKETRSAPGTARSTLAVGARFRAEIQVKTLLEHAWATLAHDNQYKGDFKLPGRLERDIHRVSAALEEADLDMARAVKEVENYRSYHGRFRQLEALKTELARIKLIFALDPSNAEIAMRVARLALTAGEPGFAEDALRGFVTKWEETPFGSGRLTRGEGLKKAIAAGSGSKEEAFAAEQLTLLHDRKASVLFLDYGRALGARQSPLGLDYMLRAAKLDPANVYAHIFLGERYYELGKVDQALTAFGCALDVTQADPEALYGYMCAKIEWDHADGFVAALRSGIRHAVTRCQDRASLGIYDPLVYCQLGLFHIYMDEPFAAMSCYARAVTLDPTLATVPKVLATIRKLIDALHGSRPELEWARRLLTAAIRARSPSRPGTEAYDDLAACRSLRPPVFTAPVVMVAGGCSSSVEEAMRAYGPLLRKAFSSFKGTVMAGGTRAGIAQLIGDLPNTAEGPIQKIAYIPDALPRAMENRTHKRYIFHEVHTSGFTPLLSIQAWVDILAAGIPVSQVRMLGINGGEISAFEYRLALAMGAKTGVIRGSGRAADAILEDPEWRTTDGLLGLPNDPQTVKLHITGYKPSPLSPKALEAMARRDHKISVPLREARIAGKAIEAARKSDKENADWDVMMPMLRASIRQRIDHMFEKLHAVGLKAVPKQSPEAREAIKGDIGERKIRIMGEMEHARYIIERLEQQFRLGDKKDWDAKTNPTLIPWKELKTDIRKRDFEYVRQGIDRLREAGYAIVPISGGKSTKRRIQL